MYRDSNYERVLGPYHMFMTAISSSVLCLHTSQLAQQQTIGAHLTFSGDICRSPRYLLTFRLPASHVAPPQQQHNTVLLS